MWEERALTVLLGSDGAESCVGGSWAECQGQEVRDEALEVGRCCVVPS